MDEDSTSAGYTIPLTENVFIPEPFAQITNAGLWESSYVIPVSSGSQEYAFFDVTASGLGFSPWNSTGSPELTGRSSGLYQVTPWKFSWQPCPEQGVQVSNSNLKVSLVRDLGIEHQPDLTLNMHGDTLLTSDLGQSATNLTGADAPASISDASHHCQTCSRDFRRACDLKYSSRPIQIEEPRLTCFSGNISTTILGLTNALNRNVLT